MTQRVEEEILEAIRRDRPDESIGFLHGIEGETDGVPWIEFKQAQMMSEDERQMETSPTRVRVTDEGIFAVWNRQIQLREELPDVLTRGIGHGHPISGLSQTDISLNLMHGDIDILFVANNTQPNPVLECFRRIQVGENEYRIVPWGYFRQTGSFRYIDGVPTRTK